MNDKKRDVVVTSDAPMRFVANSPTAASFWKTLKTACAGSVSKLVNQLCTKKCVTAASPPDVRRRLCLAVSVFDALGSAPRSAFSPQTMGEARTSGEAVSLNTTARRGKALAAHQGAQPLPTPH